MLLLKQDIIYTETTLVFQCVSISGMGSLQFESAIVGVGILVSNFYCSVSTVLDAHSINAIHGTGVMVNPVPQNEVLYLRIIYSLGI